ADNVYVKADIDDMIDNTVSITAYQTDKDGFVERFKDNESNITQNEKEIKTKVGESEFNSTTGKISENVSKVEQTAKEISQSVSEVKADVEGISIGAKNL